MVDLGVTLCGLQLKNPVIPASGTYGFGYGHAAFYSPEILGSIALKGTTEQPRFGNQTPRVAECPAGMLNSVGLQNPGVDAVINEELPRLKSVFSGKVIANVCGFSVEEYVRVARRFDEAEQVGIIELNLSCPNVECGGMSMGATPSGVARVTGQVKKTVKKPVIVKLTPNTLDITALALAAQDAGADGVAMINTVLGMRIDIKKQRPVLANARGGLSGRAIFPIAVRAVYDVYEKVNIPIVGMGGISCAEDAVEMMLAGATAVQVGAENLRDPFACKKIIDGLPSLLASLGVQSITSLIGAAHS